MGREKRERESDDQIRLPSSHMMHMMPVSDLPFPPPPVEFFLSDPEVDAGKLDRRVG